MYHYQTSPRVRGTKWFSGMMTLDIGWGNWPRRGEFEFIKGLCVMCFTDHWSRVEMGYLKLAQHILR